MDRLVGNWIEYHHTKDKSLHYAWEELFEMVQLEPDKAWSVILKILEVDSSEEIISNLAAGPLEDLLVCHGKRFINEVEIKTRQNPAFTKLIMGVWQNNMSKEIWSRVDALQSKYANNV